MKYHTFKTDKKQWDEFINGRKIGKTGQYPQSDSQFHTTGHNLHFCRLIFFLLFEFATDFHTSTKLQNSQDENVHSGAPPTKVYSVIPFIYFTVFLSSSINRVVKTTLWRTRDGRR